MVRQELLEGEPLSKLFADFEEEPLGCASIAQVSRGCCSDSDSSFPVAALAP